MVKIVFNITLLIMLAGCAGMDAKGPPFTVHGSIPQGKAFIYLLKPDSAAQDGVTTCLTLQLDKLDIGCVKGKGYIFSELQPGLYKAALVNKAAFGFKLLEFDLKVSENEVIYLEYAFGRQLNGEPLDKRFASLGLVVNGDHVIAKIEEAEALTKLTSLLLSN